jgi:2'-5' RNA ligase
MRRMKVEYFIGIVPPEEYLKRIERFQRRWMNYLGVAPHITLKAQGGLTPDKTWIAKVKKVCENFKPFQVSLGKPMYFGDSIFTESPGKTSDACIEPKKPTFFSDEATSG